jgi:protein-tyrosine phosphatase
VDAGAAEADRPCVLVLCTGNAARSVMAGVMLETGGRLRIVTAGTHVVENQPMSRRTRDALAAVGLDNSGHRSRQLSDADLDRADLVIAMAGEHVAYIRRRHPGASSRTATLAWLVDHLPAGPETLATRVAQMGLADIDPLEQGDVEDPAGGDEDTYAACAAQLSTLVAELADRLS